MVDIEKLERIEETAEQQLERVRTEKRNPVRDNHVLNQCDNESPDWCYLELKQN